MTPGPKHTKLPIGQLFDCLIGQSNNTDYINLSKERKDSNKKKRSNSRLLPMSWRTPTLASIQSYMQRCRATSDVDSARYLLSNHIYQCLESLFILSMKKQYSGK